MTDFHHEPVLKQEVIDALAPSAGGVFVDCTLGGGGHAAALLATSSCRVIGLDRDPAAIAAATQRCAPFGDRFRAVHAPFSALKDVLDELAIGTVDGILADLGVSSHQIDTAERGFSFMRTGPLDMRMDPGEGQTAATLIERATEGTLVDVLVRFGEVRRPHRVARAIVAGRPWSDTTALAAAIASAVGRPKGRIHPATRTFQALRIAVNDELGQLRALLPQAVEGLSPGGRLALITFHSLEDRIVKRFLSTSAGKGLPRDPYGNPIGSPTLQVFPSVVPSSDDPNPRARSARLRSAVRLP